MSWRTAPAELLERLVTADGAPSKFNQLELICTQRLRSRAIGPIRSKAMNAQATVLVFLLATLGTPRAEQRPFVVIHRQGDHGCHTFRIPGIAVSNQGTLLAVYDMRYRNRRDLQGHIDIGLSPSTDGGMTWEPPRPIMDMGEYGGLPQDQNGCSDPNILRDKSTGEIIVSAVWTHGKPGTHQWRANGSEPGLNPAESSQFMVVRSRDDGESWSQPENWTAELKAPAWHLFAPAPGNGITLQDGTLVMPTAGRDETGLYPFPIPTTDQSGRI
jgi:sialidase-1